MRRTWVKLYVETLRSSLIAELTPEQRWMFVGLILMAGDSPTTGYVYSRKDENGNLVGHPPAILAYHLGVHESAIEPGLARMVEKQKVTLDERGVISICNWRKYQSEYERTKHAPSRVVQKYGLDVDVDVERDGDVEKKKTAPKHAALDFDFDTRRWIGVEPIDLETWAKAYPACDITQELLKAGEWLIANPAQRKSNYRRFIVNWLARQQDRGGSGGGGNGRRVEPKASQVGKSDGRGEKPAAYWAEVRRLKAQGLGGEALSEEMKKWEATHV